MRYLTLVLLAILLTGCNLVADHGSTSASNTQGYLTYANPTLKVSLLVPRDWDRRMGNDGNYTMAPPGNDGYDAFSVHTSHLSDLYDDGPPANVTLDQVHQRILDAWYKPSDMGPDFVIESRRATLSGKPAWEIVYSFTPSGKARRWVKMVFTLDDDRIHILRWYAKAAEKDKYARQYQVVRESFRILP